MPDRQQNHAQVRDEPNHELTYQQGEDSPHMPSDSGFDEKAKSFDYQSSVQDGPHATVLAGGAIIEEKSKGVVEMESLEERVNVKFLCILYGFFT